MLRSPRDGLGPGQALDARASKACASLRRRRRRAAPVTRRRAPGGHIAAQGGAEQLAKRVAARRTEIQERMSHRVNLFASDEEIVESTEQLDGAAEGSSHAGAGSALAQALVGV